MRIGGMQKLTLLDYPGKVACTVFLSGCNLRCPYCHNPDLVSASPAGSRRSNRSCRSFLRKSVIWAMPSSWTPTAPIPEC